MPRKTKKTSSTDKAIQQLDSLTPRQIVAELDKYIIGQDDAKKAVAIALRNRARRKAIEEDMRDEIAPKNIIMIGPTGVGKTEIARRLSKLAGTPFVKVEATKYTEVGYVGRDVEAMIRDLVSMSINLVKEEMRREVTKKAEKATEDTLVDLLLPRGNRRVYGEEFKLTKERLRQQLRNRELENRIVKLRVQQNQTPMVEIFPNIGMSDIDLEFQNLMSSIMPSKEKDKKTSVKEARKILMEQEYERLIDTEKLASEAIKRAEEMGIVFIDEVDKIAGRESKSGPDISREGVQRDILPIVEGCAVHTRYGMVRTDHILFIAAGAFHTTKPSDLIPELQGRFPIRVELEALTKNDLMRILTTPKNALIKQYTALLATEQVTLEFQKPATDLIASIAFEVNAKTENIGARRLHTILEKLLEDISFEAPEREGETIRITQKYVQDKVGDIVEDRDLSRYIL